MSGHQWYIPEKKTNTSISLWLVVLTILKNISQWEGLSHILWTIKAMFQTTNQHCAISLKNRNATNWCLVIKWVYNPQYPYPYRGGGRGQNQPDGFQFFLVGNPEIVIQPLKWNCKVTFLNKPWALVRKYDDGSAIIGGMPSLHMCCFSLTCA